VTVYRYTISPSHPGQLSLAIPPWVGVKSTSKSHRTGFSDFSPLWDRAKKFVGTITYEPLNSAWWYFARTCTLTIACILLNFKVKGQGHMSFWCFFSVYTMRQLPTDSTQPWARLDYLVVVIVVVASAKSKQRRKSYRYAFGSVNFLLAGLLKKLWKGFRWIFWKGCTWPKKTEIWFCNGLDFFVDSELFFRSLCR